MELCRLHWSTLCHRNLNQHPQTRCQSQIQHPTSLRLPGHGQPLWTPMPPLSQLYWSVAPLTSLLSPYPFLLAYFRLYRPRKFGWWPLLFRLQSICFLLRWFHLFLPFFQHWWLCISNIKVPDRGTETHTDKGLSETVLELQEATPSSTVPQISSEIAVCPHAKLPKKLPPLTRHSSGKPSNGCWEHFTYGLHWPT